MPLLLYLQDLEILLLHFISRKLWGFSIHCRTSPQVEGLLHPLQDISHKLRGFSIHCRTSPEGCGASPSVAGHFPQAEGIRFRASQVIRNKNLTDQPSVLCQQLVFIYQRGQGNRQVIAIFFTFESTKNRSRSVLKTGCSTISMFYLLLL